MADERRILSWSTEDRLYDELKPEGHFSAWRRRLLAVGGAVKELATFCLSQFGLIALVVTYTLIGAYIFGQLESDHERSRLDRRYTNIFGQLERPNELSKCVEYRDLYNLAERSMVYRMWEVVTAYHQLTLYHQWSRLTSN